MYRNKFINIIIYDVCIRSNKESVKVIKTAQFPFFHEVLHSWTLFDGACETSYGVHYDYWWIRSFFLVQKSTQILGISLEVCVLVVCTFITYLSLLVVYWKWKVHYIISCRIEFHISSIDEMCFWFCSFFDYVFIEISFLYAPSVTLIFILFLILLP